MGKTMLSGGPRGLGGLMPGNAGAEAILPLATEGGLKRRPLGLILGLALYSTDGSPFVGGVRGRG